MKAYKGKNNIIINKNTMNMTNTTKYKKKKIRATLKRLVWNKWVGEKNQLSLTQMSLAWVNHQPWVTSNIIGATNLTQLKENIESIHVALSEEVLKEIDAIHNLIPNPAP